MHKNNKLRYIFKHYGERNQLIQLKEELYELIDEIVEIEVFGLEGVGKEIGNVDFLGEVADVMVMCEQFRLKYNTINSTMDYKINRQIQRIKQENSSVK
jgi:hypothetical protein